MLKQNENKQTKKTPNNLNSITYTVLFSNGLTTYLFIQMVTPAEEMAQPLKVRLTTKMQIVIQAYLQIPFPVVLGLAVMLAEQGQDYIIVQEPKALIFLQIY